MKNFSFRKWNAAGVLGLLLATASVAGWAQDDVAGASGNGVPNTTKDQQAITFNADPFISVMPTSSEMITVTFFGFDTGELEPSGYSPSIPEPSTSSKEVK